MRGFQTDTAGGDVTPNVANAVSVFDGCSVEIQVTSNVYVGYKPGAKDDEIFSITMGNAPEEADEDGNQTSDVWTFKPDEMERVINTLRELVDNHRAYLSRKGD